MGNSHIFPFSDSINYKKIVVRLFQTTIFLGPCEAFVRHPQGKQAPPQGYG